MTAAHIFYKSLSDVCIVENACGEQSSDSNSNSKKNGSIHTKKFIAICVQHFILNHVRMNKFNDFDAKFFRLEFVYVSLRLYGFQ